MQKWVRSQGQANYKLSFAEHTIPTDNERISQFLVEKIFKGSFILQIRKMRTRRGSAVFELTKVGSGWHNRDYHSGYGVPFKFKLPYTRPSPTQFCHIYEFCALALLTAFH